LPASKPACASVPPKPPEPPLASPASHSQRLYRNSTSKSPAPPQPSTAVITSWNDMRSDRVPMHDGL
jgi:hypothetical protein